MYLSYSLKIGKYCAKNIMTETFLCNNSDTNFKVACCSNYYYSQEEGKCVPCSDGYYGYNCNKTCPAGFYGSSCTSQCTRCDEDKCDFRYGCESQEALKKTVATTTEIKFTTKAVETPPSSAVKHLSSQVAASKTQKSTTVTDIHLTKTTHIPVAIVTESPPLQITLNSNTILIGIGGLISLLLMVIILQRCLKSKSKKRKISRNSKRAERQSDTETYFNKSKISKLSSTQSGRENYHELRGSTNDITNEQLESHYQELDQCLDVISLSSPIMILTDEASTRTPYIEPVQNNTYIAPVSPEKIDDELQTTESYIEPSRKISTNEQPHTYIDIIEPSRDGDKCYQKDIIELQFSPSETLDFDDNPAQDLNDTYLDPVNTYKTHSL
ncbi:uncharacterized protein LOC134247203 isoform X2 [Saccostrea cucullata]|uniref:uncharacterized protein LOC134247203 isoform X2 n=1 Tax=Saccostrea cuccullata TaxID=36930 RepID=UPI002ED13881